MVRLLTLLALLLLASPAHAVKVRVVGATALDARLVRTTAGAELTGTLRDDAGRPVGGAVVAITLASAGSGPLVACARGSAAPAPDPARGGAWVVTTDTGGRFCARATRLLEGRVELRYAGDPLRAGAERVLEAGQGTQLALVFAPEPGAFPLERERHTVWVESRLDPLASPSEDTLQLEAVLFEPGATEGRVIGTGTGRVGERVAVDFPTTELGSPGPARLAVRVAGPPAQRGPIVEGPVLRTARVTLALVGGSPKGDPLEGIVLPLTASWERGAVPSGSVEAVLGRDSVGTATVEGGAARLVTSFQAARPGELALTASYLPVSPWWVPREPLLVTVVVEPPSRWRQWPWWALAAAVGAWLAYSWRRPGPAPVPRQPAPQRSGKAELVFLDEGAPGPGWRGQVVDAHDGTPVVGAEVVLAVPSFDPRSASVRAVTDGDGRFDLPPLPGGSAEGARLEASGRWHARLVRAVPRQGAIRIQLVTRRRAILGRLVEWARHQLPRAPSEPTPAQVARLASELGNPAAARWARAVEDAAFGPAPVGEPEEAALLAQEPHPVVPPAGDPGDAGRR